MSFIKVTDPKKREALIKDFIETRKRIKDNFVAKKVGEIEYQRGLTKLFKPVTETQKATAKEITEAQKEAVQKITGELLPIKESLEKFTSGLIPIEGDITESQDIPAVEMTKEEIEKLGSIATKYISKYFTSEGGEKSSGLNMNVKSKNFKIGSEPIKTEENNIILDDIVYEGTPGLWKLITSKNIPDISEYEAKDFYNYIYLMANTNTAHINYNPNKKYRGGNNNKMNNLIKPFVKVFKDEGDNELIDKIEKHFNIKTGEETNEDKDDPHPSTSGTGLTILPSDPNALIDRFDLLFSSQNAGHTGVRNEIISILDELKRQGVINTKEYKKLNHVIKK